MIVWMITELIVKLILCCVVYDSCTVICTHTHEQFLQLSVDFWVEVALLCVYLLLAFCVFFFCFSLDHVLALFDFVVLVWFLQYYAKRLAGKNVSKMTCFVSSGT